MHAATSIVLRLRYLPGEGLAVRNGEKTEDQPDDSIRQTHPGYEAGEAGILSNRIEQRLHVERHQPAGALVICLFEEREGLIHFTETEMNERMIEGRDVPRLRNCLQLLQHLPCFRHPPLNPPNPPGLRGR